MQQATTPQITLAILRAFVEACLRGDNLAELWGPLVRTEPPPPEGVHDSDVYALDLGATWELRWPRCDCEEPCKIWVHISQVAKGTTWRIIVYQRDEVLHVRVTRRSATQELHITIDGETVTTTEGYNGQPYRADVFRALSIQLPPRLVAHLVNNFAE